MGSAFTRGLRVGALSSACHENCAGLAIPSESSSITRGRTLIPSHRIPAHPGQVLRDEFIDALGITPAELAAHLSIAPQRLHRIVRGKRAVTAETAWLLSQAFDTTPEFWLSLQAAHDLASRKPKRRIRPICDVG